MSHPPKEIIERWRRQAIAILNDPRSGPTLRDIANIFLKKHGFL